MEDGMYYTTSGTGQRLVRRALRPRADLQHKYSAFLVCKCTPSDEA